MTDAALWKAAVRHSSCQLCRGPIAPKFRKQTEDGVFDLVGCRNCGFVFVNPTPSEDDILQFYATAGHGEGRVHSSAASVLEAERARPSSTLDAARIVGSLADLTAGRRLLDVGCGYGLFSRAAIAAGFDVAATEIAATERSIAADILGFEPMALTFEAIPEDQQYDAIILSQILEHARDPDGWMRKMMRMLQSDGVAAIALPNFDSIFTNLLGSRDPYVTPPAHLNYFNARNLTRHAKRLGFRVERVETVSRIPIDSFIRRMGGLAGGAASAMFATVGGVLDIVLKGAILNVYLRKV